VGTPHLGCQLAARHDERRDGLALAFEGALAHDERLFQVALPRAPPGPLEAKACRPPEANARRHRFADIWVTLNHRGHLPVTGPGLDQISGFEPRLLTPSPLLGRQPTAIGIPHLPGTAHPTGAVTTRRNPHR
jgi:hypothetical protein